LLYAVIMVSAVTISAPVMRLLVFSRAAKYAETGKLDSELTYNRFTPAMVHYWITNVICYTTAIICVSSLLR
jgi:hypothetical protein